MPKFVQVIADAIVNAAIEVLGTQVRVAILAYLAENGPATRGQIVKAISPIGVTTVQSSLVVLVKHGAVTADPPEAKSGQRVQYTHNPKRVAELHAALGAAVHVASK